MVRAGLEPDSATVCAINDFGNPDAPRAAKSDASGDVLPPHLRELAAVLTSLSADDCCFIGRLLALPDADRQRLADLLDKGG